MNRWLILWAEGVSSSTPVLRNPFPNHISRRGSNAWEQLSADIVETTRSFWRSINYRGLHNATSSARLSVLCTSTHILTHARTLRLNWWHNSYNRWNDWSLYKQNKTKRNPTSEHLQSEWQMGLEDTVTQKKFWLHLTHCMDSGWLQ